MLSAPTHARDMLEEDPSSFHTASGKDVPDMTHRARFTRTAGLGLALCALFGLTACGGQSENTPTETVTVSAEPETTAPAAETPDAATPEATDAASGPETPNAQDSPAATGGSANSADGSDPFGGMAAVTGSLTAAETCDYIDAFRANMPGNVSDDPAGAREAVAQLRSAAPQELSGNLRGMEQVLRNFENGNNPMQAVEGKMTGLTNQCRGLANR